MDNLIGKRVTYNPPNAYTVHMCEVVATATMEQSEARYTPGLTQVRTLVWVLLLRHPDGRLFDALHTQVNVPQQIDYSTQEYHGE